MTRCQSRSNLRECPSQIAALLPGEQWRPVADYPGYFVSNMGRVCSVDRVVMRSNGAPQFCPGTLLRQKVKDSGHLVVSLSMRAKEYVHVLVLTAFKGPCPVGSESLHDDDCPSNNQLSNLSWGTRSSNLYDAIENGKKPIGEQNWNAKLTEESVRFIRANPDLSVTKLAVRFGVSRKAVDKVREFQTWRHVA